ncbi:MAG: ABC transporter ATP-binding protein [Actinomycetota bacterium]|nr:ABC transporter ATP-binding protein [Actinomycetota bacterium]
MSTATSRWRALGALMRPDARRWTGLGLLVALSSGFSLAGPLVVRRIIDLAGEGGTAAELTSLALVFLGLAVATQIILVIVSWFSTVTAWHTTNQIRLQLAEHVLGLDHEFHRRHTPGELIQRVDGDVTSVSDFLGRVVPRVAGAAAMVLGMLGVLFVVDWRLALGSSVYVTVAAGTIVRGRHRAVGESTEEMGSYAQLYGGIEERLTAAEDLRANGAGAHAMWRFVEESSDAMNSSVRRESAFLRLWWAVQGSVAVGSAVSLIAGAVLVTNGSITLGTAFLMFQYVLLLERPLEDVVQQLEVVQKANGAMVRVIDLLAVQPTILDIGTSSPAAGPLAVEFDGVSFEYADETDDSTADDTFNDTERVLHDLSFTLAAGRSMGIVGRTGSGKTTLSRLLLRLVESTHGELRLGGVPIADIPMTELRRRVAMIPQEVELFSGTVRDNVTLFDPQPTDAQVEHALGRVGLGALVAGGIHRELGAGGAGLSAGEAQLLALARVWLREPDLVVLDEATARVDPATEARLEVAIAEMMRGRTTIVIAHRLRTLRHVDEILVLDHGVIVEHGKREALAGDDGSRFHHLLELALEGTS